MDSASNIEVDNLLKRLAAVYSLKRIKLNLAGQAFEIFKVEDIDPLLDLISDPEEIPFWAELWPASIGLARFILEHANAFQGKSVLELGAGVGLAGIAAKKVSATTIQSDYVRPALEFCRLNCELNKVPVSDFLLADWRSFSNNIGKFDRIIGSDILYEKTLHSALANVFNRHLNPGGKVILADPGRDYAKIFMDQSRALDWMVDEVLIPVAYDSKTYQIRVYQLSKPGEP